MQEVLNEIDQEYISQLMIENAKILESMADILTKVEEICRGEEFDE